jgi:hypothetical protein
MGVECFERSIQLIMELLRQFIAMFTIACYWFFV